MAMLPPPLPRTESSQSLGTSRPQRPLLPKIDATAAFRPPVFHGELTPASSGHSSMVSPLSATSGPRSPWPTGRKGSLPVARRPPSPELTNLDCAFPPFPLPSRAPTTKRRDKSSTQRSDTHRSRSRDTSRSSRQNSRAVPLSRAESSNNLSLAAQEMQLPDRRRPSTPSSRKNSSSTRSNSRQQSLDKLPELHVTLSEEQRPSTSPSPSHPNEPTQAPNLPPQLLRSNTEPPARSAAVDPGLGAFDFGTTQNNMTEQTDANNDLMFNSSRIADKPRTETLPSYKSKAPPPIAGPPPPPAVLSKLRTPTTPQPSPPGVFSATFGRLFGRRQSQSTSSRREVARQALSDEPDIYEEGNEGRSVLSLDSDKSFLLDPSPDLPTTPLTPSAPLPVHEEALKALEGEAASPSTTPVVVIEPTPEDEERETAPVTPSEPVRHPRISTILEELPEIETLPTSKANSRDSIDSASSYGSIGFSEHTSSSRSSSPQTDSLPIKPIEDSTSGLLVPDSIDVPAPLRPRIPEVSADLSAEALFQQGHYPPTPEKDSLAQQPNKSVMPASHASGSSPTLAEAPAETAAAVQSVVSINPKLKRVVPNKGICRGCSKFILVSQKSVTSADGLLTGRYHKECFVCHTCKAAFPTAEFYVHSDHPYCAHHYHELENSLCATCGKGIEGLYMETANVAGRGKEKHHPECLKCATCHVRLDHDYFELSGKVYCERDAFRLASLPKSRDNAPSRPSPLIREYISSGQDPGMVKGRNFPERRVTRLMNMT
ncbi:hypothetical protein LTR47_009091 [Exophiala xenobiotica]|nr:hypothetical protein LTR92_005240 [Exophiala xenobiotica]KAK5537002.1 hypothetical protein LTR23_007699 [Chaetothyriales sp. CCFEE 6169]KAK5209693.1 hypothetical protein LTR41_004325 [Exophiala xenobiotica]KAK5226413.1 hypothetical protein LTR47_009091 [Exophiala xenobiotica]KAK5341066.1 hypothetical protein LTR98_001858 [Exophiala xenobiotica]